MRGEEGRVLAADGEACGAGTVGVCHALEQPGRGVVERVVGRMLEAGERCDFIGQERRDLAGAGLVGVLGDAAHERHRLERGGKDDFLPVAEAKADIHGNLGQAVEPGFVARCAVRGCDSVHRCLPLVGMTVALVEARRQRRVVGPR